MPSLAVPILAADLLSHLLPDRCGVCGSPGPSPCRSCLARLPRCAPPPVPPGLDDLAVLLSFEGEARDLVARIKYRNARGSLRWLGGSLAALAAPWSPDVVTWVPTTAAHRRARGFDHAELLARRVAAAAGTRCAGLLDRADAASQTGRSAADRWSTARFRARALPGGPVWPRSSVLLVDDVVTTGASMAAAARALRSAGADAVFGLAAARTP